MFLFMIPFFCLNYCWFSVFNPFRIQREWKWKKYVELFIVKCIRSSFCLIDIFIGRSKKKSHLLDIHRSDYESKCAFFQKLNIRLAAHYRYYEFNNCTSFERLRLKTKQIFCANEENETNIRINQSTQRLFILTVNLEYELWLCSYFLVRVYCLFIFRNILKFFFAKLLDSYILNLIHLVLILSLSFHSLSLSGVVSVFFSSCPINLFKKIAIAIISATFGQM